MKLNLNVRNWSPSALSVSTLSPIAIYLILFAILLLIKKIIYKKEKQQNYAIQNLLLITIMTLFTGEQLTLITIILTLIEIIIYIIMSRIINKKKEKNKIPIGYYLCINNIITFLVCYNFIQYLY